MQSFQTRVVGANADAFVVQFVDADGTGIDLTGGTAIFKMQLQRSPFTVAIDDQAASIPAGTSGLVSYAPSTAEIGTAGDYVCRVTATEAGGAVHKAILAHVIIPDI